MESWLAPHLQPDEPVELQTLACTPETFVCPVPPDPRAACFPSPPLCCIRRNAITFGTMIKHIVLAGIVQRISTTPKWY